MAILLIWLLLFKSHAGANIQKFFEDVNETTKKFNAIGADIAWQSSLEPGNPELADRAADYQQKLILWQHSTCKTLATLHDHLLLNTTQERQACLLCRGPKFLYKEAREISNIYEGLQSIYSNIEVCIPDSEHKTSLPDIESAILKYLSTVREYLNFEQNSVNFAAKVVGTDGIKKDGLLCLNGEDSFEKLMEFSRKPDVLEWVWTAWREKIKPMREHYRRLVDVENKAAKRNGNRDIGVSWRDELEIPNLRVISRQLFNSVKPLYALLHGVVRFYLHQEYGDIVPERGPIPAHLLGNLWSQNWASIIDLILPKVINFDDRMKHLNWTVKDMVKRAEDFYMSLGLPPMTDTFWRESVFSRQNHELARCHGTAADMFKEGDFRLLYCSGVSFEDFYVVHHEMGHIQYFMAYEKQPTLFRQANTGLQESIGDAVMYGVTTPQHLHRLRLINDTELYNTKEREDPKTTTKDKKDKRECDNNSDIPKCHREIEEVFNDYISSEAVTMPKESSDTEFDTITTDDILILRQALTKIPQIPFALLIEEYRWKYFEGSLDTNTLNQEFWEQALELQGITPPGFRGEEYFDIGASFHVPDNTPYSRYFLSSFLQHQIFESLCKAAVFGHRNAKEQLPDSISLNRCDIYGSKAAGKILKDIMSRGSSQHWQQILQETTGKSDISALPLKRYYRPLYKLLMRLVQKYDIPIGW